MKLNTRPRFTERTHEGAPVARFSVEQQLRRSVLSCLLWEKEFYEDGEEISRRIEALCDQVPQSVIAALAVEAREVMHLRHAPLLLLCCLAKRGGSIVGDTIARVIQRADELSELVAIYWRDGKRPLSAQIKKGLARAFTKFDAYQLAKYDRAGAVRLRDVLFLSHARPEGEAQAVLWRQLVDGTLASPDTWEVELSGGGNKREVFERLLREGKLGYLALLRNLRNMAEAGVDRALVTEALRARKGAQRVLPFRYVAAARAAPLFDAAIDAALQGAVAELPRLAGTTFVLVDVSGSMDNALSSKSDLKRIDAAAALASIVPAEDLRVFSFSEGVVEVPARRGLAGIDAIVRSQAHSGTRLGAAVGALARWPHDRLIVITDEQSADVVPDPVCKHAYMINVASNRNGVGSGKWHRIDGFSENILRYIQEVEASHD